MRGRKPRPTASKELDGNPGKRPLNTQEPQPPPLDAATLDAPPAELADHPLAVAEWNRLAPMLRLARQITAADRGALVALCLEWARYLDAIAAVKAEGLIIKAPSGYPIQNPCLSIATRALAGCNKLWPELGLTPSSRSRVQTAGHSAAGAPPDDFAEFDTPIPSVDPSKRSTSH